MTTVTHLRWRKASASGQDSNCVEVAHTRGALRDSKNQGGPVLFVNVRALVAAIKEDRTDGG